jgi:nitroreductase/dihydropteridine reductase
MNLNQSLEWRYATKKMNGQSISEEKIKSILRAIQLAPSSMGLQPYTIVVVSNPEWKQKILPAANNQSQITDCSHLLVFSAWENVSKEQVDEFISRTATTRGMNEEMLNDFKNYLLSIVEKNTQEQNFQWAAKQVYLALGMGLAAAATEQVDATPMEGFNPQALDDVLELKALGLKSVALLALGYRDAEKDWLVNLKKVRRDADNLFIYK